MHLRRLVPALLLLVSASVIVAAPAQAGPAQDRDNAAITKLLTYFNADTGQWTTPTGDAWQPALGIDALINSYERTGSVTTLNAIEKSFARYVGRRSYYFDDDGWYLNAWLRAYDVTGDKKYLDEAKAIFTDFTAAWDGTCGGGVWWNKDRAYKNAVTNELFLLSAARLHRRAANGTGAGSYYDWAFKEWNWFRNSGMINSSNIVNDGLNSSCQNNGGITWTYNQGIILGGLVELWRITGNRDYLYRAELIAEATINNQVWSGGILREPCEINNNCDGDQKIFKGIFAQGLSRLYNADRGNKPAYGTFLTNNANSVWNNDRDSSNGFGLTWKGPVGSVDQATHASGTLLISEVALLESGGETSTVPAATGTGYEAENAARTNLGTESTHAGYSGSGYVAGWNSNGQKVDFTVNVSSARSYRLTFRFAAAGGDAYRYLAVNGSSRADRMLFTGTGSWSTYRTVSINATLQAGNNTITLAYDSGRNSSQYLNLDRLNIT
jgi:predicted alpha-1,6-mannanase (GH76 family)